MFGSFRDDPGPHTRTFLQLGWLAGVDFKLEHNRTLDAVMGYNTESCDSGRRRSRKPVALTRSVPCTEQKK